MNLFDRAKTIGLQTVKEWLPGGRVDGSEYVCYNPTRIDNTLNTFKINLDTGLWSDFKTGDSGADAVSCFAYCNNSEMERRARASGYKNVDGGTQVEAAKEILALYDLDYYPSESDSFEVPKTQKKKDFWSGFHQLRSGVNDPPDDSESIEWMINNVKELKSVRSKWEFTDKKGNVFFKVVRFIDVDGQKNDRPLTLWKNGNEIKWRCKGFKELTDSGLKIPLYNRHKFEIDNNLPVLMVEGQKCASAADNVLSELFLCTTEYGGLKNCELEVLRGRIVYRWIDPDAGGYKKLKQFKELANDLDITLHVVKSPPRKVKWDIADAIEEGWTAEQLQKYIEEYEETTASESYIDDGLDFKIIGVTNTDIFFFPRGSKIVKSYKQNGLTKNVLMTLMDRDTWGEYFAKQDGGIAWDSAVNYILRQAENAPFYYNTMIRGAGAWKDRGRLVINCGTHLLVDGIKTDLYDFDSDYIYEKKDNVPYSVTESFSSNYSMQLIDILKNIDFTHKTDHLILAGWLLLSAFGGALRWRPKVWLSGPRGAGKSYIIDEIITPIVGHDFGHISPGTSSEAAIRRQAGTNSLPNIHDEMESDNKQYAENINNILMFYRVGASGENGGIIKVADNGNIQKWISQCMALFASIGAAIKNGADRSRITVINLRPARPIEIKEREKKFKALEEKVSILNRAWSIGFNSRTLQIWPEVERCIKVMINICTDRLGSRREGDQIGTLLAGAYMVMNDKAPLASEAADWIDTLDIENVSSDKHEKPDEEMVIDEILTYSIMITEKNESSYKMTISNLLIYWFISSGVSISDSARFSESTYNIEIVKKALEEHGIKPVYKKESSYIAVAKGHPKIREMLKNTAWQENYADFLKRLEFADDQEHGPTNFAGINKRYIQIDALGLLDQPPF
jgi:putative DNA primase/helicase